jgi:transglutaminase-like putative cysteine protease
MIDGDALRDRSELATEVALGVITVVTAISFARVFIGWSWLAPLLLAAIGSHMVAATARRWNLSLAVSSVVSLVALVVVTTIAFYRNTMWFFLPTRTTWHTFTADVADAWHRFALSVPPVDPAKGFLVAAVLAVWLAGTLADGFAFHVRAGVEALLPSALVFVFVSGLAADRLRLLSAVLWLVAALVFGVLHRNLRQLTAGGWLTRHRRGVVSSNLAVGGAIGLVVLLVTLVVAPSLPGYGAPPVINPHNRANDGTVISPFVQIKGRLVNQSDKEVFAATSSAKTYWRLTALETYSNEQWSSQRTYGDADGLLGGGVSSRYTRTVTQQITLTSSLDSAWLPAAYSPQRVDTATQIAVRYDRESSSLFRQDTQVKAGFTYTVTSAVPNLNPDLLREATDAPSTKILKTYTQLDEFPDDLRALAASIAVGDTPYDKALALQNWFRDKFTYDINVPTGQGTSAIRTFLKNQRGYCEQFAGTFAVFARSVGLPARVAVGFTPGTLETDGKYHVEGRHAHAWPEVYLTGIGWVPFEPTPERGNPDAATYTGVPPQQVDEAPPTTVSTATTTAFPAENFGFPEIDLSKQGPGAGVTGTPTKVDNSVPRWLVKFGIVVVVLLVVGGGWMIAVPRLKRSRWERRRRAATNAAGRAIVAWNEVTTALGHVGVPPQPCETPLEYAHRATRARVTDGRRLVHLAELVTIAAYSLVDVSDEVVAECEADRDAIQNGLTARSSRITRVWQRIDPRPLFAVLPGEEAVERADGFDSGWSVRAEREGNRHAPVG